MNDITAPAGLRVASPDQAADQRGIKRSAIRAWIFYAQDRADPKTGKTIPANGFAPAVIRVEGRVLIDLDELDAFLERGRMAPRTSAPRPRPNAAPPPYPPKKPLAPRKRTRSKTQDEAR